MINFNGNLTSKDNLLANNRAFLYGDAVFETLKVVNGTILFWEDHYFRLMSSMRIVRMEIPMNFTMEFLQEQINLLLDSNNINNSARVRITVFRNNGGLYLPETNEVSFLISASSLENQQYLHFDQNCEIDLYKDFYVSKQLLSNIKTTNKIINVTASIFAKENGLDNCILLNESKNVVEVLQGNLFMVVENKLITPPLSEGCINGIMRKKCLEIARKIDGIEVIEAPISTFELQKADELFYTNIIRGVQSITKYRKKEYTIKVAPMLIDKLNEIIVS